MVQPVHRPAGVFVLAIFHFVVGGMGLMCNICSGIGLAADQAASKAAPPPGFQEDLGAKVERIVSQKAPSGRKMQLADAVLSLFIYAALILAGVGLLMLAPWGRLLSIGLAVVLLIEKAAVMVFVFVVMNPALDEAKKVVLAEAKTPEERQGMEIGFSAASKGVLLGPPCFVIVYAIVVLLMTGTESFKAAFVPQAAGLREAGFGQPPDNRWPPPPGGYPPPNDQFRSG